MAHIELRLLEARKNTVKFRQRRQVALEAKQQEDARRTKVVGDHAKTMEIKRTTHVRAFLLP